MALPIFQRTVVDDEGNIVAGATVTVLRESTGLAANIYSDRAGAAALSNPFTTGSDGLARFYAAPGEYRIQVSGPSTSVDWRYQILGGTASTYDVTSSETDTTEGRILKTGDFDVSLLRSGFVSGDTSVPAGHAISAFNSFDFSKDFDNLIYATNKSINIENSNASWLNAPVNDWLYVDVDAHANEITTNWIRQTATTMGTSGFSNRTFTRIKRDGIWTAWQETLHTGNTGSIVTEDYEEGTWSPVLGWSAGDNYTMNTGTSRGYYKKIGNMVTCTVFQIEWTADATVKAGELVVEGLPYSSFGSSRASGSIAAILNSTITSSSPTYTYFGTIMDPGVNRVFIVQMGNGVYSHTPTVAASGMIFGFTITYFIA